MLDLSTESEQVLGQHIAGSFWLHSFSFKLSTYKKEDTKPTVLFD